MQMLLIFIFILTLVSYLSFASLKLSSFVALSNLYVTALNAYLFGLVPPLLHFLYHFNLLVRF